MDELASLPLFVSTAGKVIPDKFAIKTLREGICCTPMAKPIRKTGWVQDTHPVSSILPDISGHGAGRQCGCDPFPIVSDIEHLRGRIAILNNHHLLSIRPQKGGRLQCIGYRTGNTHRTRGYEFGGMCDYIIAHISLDRGAGNSQCTFAGRTATGRMWSIRSIIGKIPFQGVPAPVSH